ncbi:MAG: type II secretion system F family protein [Zetaproteobacteria bacterium]|nr:type II secretion system F family protein [Zetaproteobacteria bacterium]
MNQFKYSAIDKRGKSRQGNIAATSKSQARLKLLEKGMSKIRVTAPPAGENSGDTTPILGNYIYKDANGAIQIELSDNRPSATDIIIFTKQFATMIGSGVPIIQSLMVLAKQQKSPGFQKSLSAIQTQVENGATLSAALKADAQNIFDTLYVAMVEAGEESGNIDEILLRLVEYIEKAEKIKKQVKSAMIYPVLVIGVALAVISGLLAFVVPAFAQQFQDTGRELPQLTQIVIDLSDYFMQTYPFYILCLFATTLGIYVYRRTEKGKVTTDRWLIEVPVVGDLLKKIAVGRFCSTMSSMLGSGVNLLESLSICAKSSGNKTVEEAIEGVRRDLEEGLNLSESLSKNALFPDMVISMVHVGESTGALSEMLHKVSLFYEDEVDNAVQSMLAMIEPIMIVIIGLLVGFIVVAMYLPIFDLAGGVA